MILLLGGTADSSSLARKIAERGMPVLFSTVTGITLDLSDNNLIERRRGLLDSMSMEALIRDRGIRVIVDATHPYAQEVKRTARQAAERTGIACFFLTRPSGIPDNHKGIEMVSNHDEAATAAFSHGLPVLLTTGAKNIEPYAKLSGRSGIKLVARVLPEKSSKDVCLSFGIPEKYIITGRGPFSIHDNTKIIRRFGIGVLVTKDSGTSGGTPDKIEAARREGCHVVVVRRPPCPSLNTFADQDMLVQKIVAYLSR